MNTEIGPEDGNAIALIELLRNMPAAGDGSFENLVRDLLSRTTGRRFIISKPGPQGGIDGRTSDDRHATAIGVEAKRYGADTRLPLDETKSKIRDAAANHADLDLWILVATREIKEPDRGTLIAEGSELGIQILILDWPDSSELIPGLLLLCAAHEDVLAPYGLTTSAVIELLKACREHPSFPHQIEELTKDLCRPELGYANARDAMSTRMRENMASMQSATARIGRYTNLTDPAMIRIDRPAIRDAIRQWWEAPAPRPVLALLGTEGMGKTWAALSWWLDRELADNPLPLTLIVPGKYVALARPDEVIGGALYEMFQTRTAQRWAKRARRWCADAIDTRLILILDGLNERFEEKEWSRLCAELTLAPWTGAVSVVVTDRVDHWRLIGTGFGSAEIACAELPIAHFSEEELDVILGRAGLERSKLDTRLLGLLRVPRLCTLALRHWKRLGSSGDITPERLIYEDFRDRVFPGLSDDEMRNLIATIGQQIRAADTTNFTVLRRHIREALAEESGQLSSDALISDIVSGIWFAPKKGEPNQIRVNPDLAPVAIGLALARSVQDAATRHDVGARITAFVDDMRGLELGVSIVGIAASFATIWPHSTAVARDTLLDTWLASDNFSQGELRRYARVIQEAPPLFLERTEAVWRDRQRLHDDRQIHLAGMVNAAEAYPAVLDAFVEKVTQWLGEAFGWRDAMNGGQPIPELTTEAVRSRVEAWNAARGELPGLTMITFVGDEDWLSVAGSTITAISYLPRAPFAAALGTYAVSMAVSNRVHYLSDQFEWLLRANDVDPKEAEAALGAQAHVIAAVQHAAALPAATLLLEALSSLDSALQPAPKPKADNYGYTGEVVLDADEAVRWDPAIPKGEAHWGVRALRNIRELEEAAEDPSSRLHPDSLALLREAFSHALRDNGDHSLLLHGHVRKALARWAPDLLLDYLDRGGDIAHAGRGQSIILHGLQASWIAHIPQTTDDIRLAFETEIIAAQAQGTGITADFAVLALSDLTVEEQYDAFAAMPAGPSWPIEAAPLIKDPGEAEFARLAEFLDPANEPKRLIGWLGLVRYSTLDALPPGFAPVAALLGHENNEVRKAAIQVAVQAPDPQLANIVRDSGWRAADRDAQEAVHGSFALVEADWVEGDDRAERVYPMALGSLARRWPEDARYQQAFAAYVKDRVDRELSPNGRIHGFGFRIEDRLSYTRLIEEQGDEVETWLAPVIAGAPIASGHMMFSAERAVVEVIRALLDAGRESGAAALRALLKTMRGSSLKSDELLILPFRVAHNVITDALRWESLGAAILDDTLHDIAQALQRRDETPWLIDAVDKMMGGTVLDHARALVLAGELDDTPEAGALWLEVINPLALSPWLSNVREEARRRYRRNIHARAWLTRFCDTQNPQEAFSAFDLFAHSASRTCVRWATDTLDAARPRLSQRAIQHWEMNVPALNRRLKESDKEGNDRLAYRRVPKTDQSPWR